jgi:hypothetical protein
MYEGFSGILAPDFRVNFYPTPRVRVEKKDSGRELLACRRENDSAERRDADTARQEHHRSLRIFTGVIVAERATRLGDRLHRGLDRATSGNVARFMH